MSTQGTLSVPICIRTQQAGPLNRPAAYHNITPHDAMPAEDLTAQEGPRFTHRNIEYRLLPGSRAKGAKLQGLAGACRYAWNTILGDLKDEYKEVKERGEDKPNISKSFFSLGKRFTALRRETDWLPEYSYAVVRYTLKYQADAWTAFFKQGKGHPKFHSKNGSTPSFTIPENVRIKGSKLHIPKVGYVRLRRRGGNPYPDGKPVKAVIKQRLGKWYAIICYKVEVPEQTDNGVSVGIDRNCGQYAYTTTTGEQGFLLKADTKAEEEADRKRRDLKEARLKRYQRKLARQQKGSNRRYRTKKKVAKWSKRIANARKNRNHHASKAIAAKASTAYIEALKTKNMTASAKGTVEAPGKNVRQKAGLNRSILATGWGQFEPMLSYKCLEVIKVQAAYTSQQCNACGHTEKDNRKTQKVFKCVACGHKINADYNASANILASGIGAAARGGALTRGSPMSREMDTRRAV